MIHGESDIMETHMSDLEYDVSIVEIEIWMTEKLHHHERLAVLMD
jgi:hypothetical protein